MPNHHQNQGHGHGHNNHRTDGLALAHRVGQEVLNRPSGTKYIINEGNLVVSERFLNKHHSSSNNSSSRSNVVIYNSPGSTMWVQSTKKRHSSHHRSQLEADAHHHHHVHRAREVIVAGDRHAVEFPERKAIAWR